jgi:queuine tRNA-ribosyltransferase
MESTGARGFGFQVQAVDRSTRARLGTISTPHGTIDTPGFAVVGTQASVKGLTPDDLRACGVQVVLSNTYHLYLRPGADLIARQGGLHRFMSWSGPLMTDSGGFQVFSLGFALEHGVGKIAGIFPGHDAQAPRRPVRRRLAKIDEDGVTFASHLDGSIHKLTPEVSIDVQEKLGADIILAFDECTSPLSDYDYTREAMERTHRWARRSLDAKTRDDQALFGIVQGGEYRDLREQSTHFIANQPFDGFAIGGSLGKSKDDMHAILDWTLPFLPAERPRHLLGIGDMEDIVAGTAAGIDTFDCVAPTRLARHGALYTRDGRINITGARYRLDAAPIDDDCSCYTCQRFSRAYVRHLFVAGELLAYRLATMHNLHFLLRFVREMRESIAAGHFADFRREFSARRGSQRRAGDVAG